jgi:hydroxyethylthiazole kinase-like uncharacterized protein yjeF
MGRAALIAGSRGMAGAAALMVGGALRSGVGYALLDCPGAIAATITTLYPEAVLHPHGDDSRQVLKPEDVPALIAAASDADAVGVGPGLGNSKPSQHVVVELLQSLALTQPQKPVLLDADALNHVAAARVSLAALGFSALVITPHPGEAARLLNGSAGGGVHAERGVAEVQADRNAAATELAEITGAVVVLKGEGTLVSSAAGISRNTTGNPGMATAGSGDVLSGILTALMARGMAPFDAARLAVHLHGSAGDLAAADLGQESLIASDLIRFLPAAILQHQTAS